MKFERIALEEYLVSNLKPLTAADPKILADYVVALLKNEMPRGELLKLCADRLEVFLGSSSMSFTAKLFQGLQDGSISSTDANLGVIKELDPAHCNTSVEASDQKSSQQKEANDSTSSEPDSDPGDKENTDDDDDRNHKHRKRDARPTSSDNGVQELPAMTLSRKRSKSYVTRQLNVEIGTLDKENHSRMEKRQSGIQQLCGPLDLSLRSRINSSFRADPSSRIDLSTSVGRASGGRGRGKSSGGWIRPDSRLNSLDTLDFAPHIASQGPAHPSLFVSPGLQSVGSSQNASWNPFGFIHGMPGGILDPLHPLALQAALRPAMNPPLNLGLPRQRCRDFEERGFCLRGDMCPMEHGVNRIVVEDVQSLSQFNLPVSIPSSQALVQTGTGSIPPGPGSLAVVTSKTLPCKNNKSSANEDDEPRFTDLSSVASEADVYDPDQPLWNSNHHVSSGALLRLPASNTEEDTVWDGSASFRKSSRLSDGNECDLSSRNLTGNTGRQSAGSSVWGHTGSGSKLEVGVKFDNNGSTTGHLTQAMKEVEENVSSSVPSSQDKHVTAGDFGSELAITQPVSNSILDYRRRSGRVQQKASRTLYVNGIPQKNNKREALLSHFQKFGEVIDVYIPLNSEKAFVQFSRKEEAEAALKSPDAVMGNRFIKLFWANRDRISDEGLISGLHKSPHYPKTSADSVQIQPPVVSGGKDNLSSAAHKKSSLVPVEVPVPSFGPQRSIIMNGSKALTSPTKKQESLELLEELRKKQEILDQKREEFRRQLVKFERQASLKKGEVASELVVKNQKLNPGIASAKAADPRPTTSNSGECQDDGKTLEKSSSGDILRSSRAYPVSMQQSPRIVKQSARMVAPNPHRFKLDNRSTSFRVLPPLPAKLANVSVLKDHFSKFGDLASIVFEDSEEILKEQTDKLGSKELDSCFIRVKYHTRHSAERAYQAGKSWEGCSLKFAWVTTSLSSDKDNLVQEVPINTLPCVTGDDANKASMEPAFLSRMGEITCNSSAGSPSLNLREPNCIPASEVDAKKIEGPKMNLESTNCASNSMIKSRSTIPTHENENDNSEELIDNDNIEANPAQ